LIFAPTSAPGIANCATLHTAAVVLLAVGLLTLPATLLVVRRGRAPASCAEADCAGDAAAAHTAQVKIAVNSARIIGLPRYARPILKTFTP
jgi:hypothetical protein